MEWPISLVCHILFDYTWLKSRKFSTWLCVKLKWKLSRTVSIHVWNPTRKLLPEKLLWRQLGQSDDSLGNLLETLWTAHRATLCQGSILLDLYLKFLLAVYLKWKTNKYVELILESAGRFSPPSSKDTEWASPIWRLEYCIIQSPPLKLLTLKLLNHLRLLHHGKWISSGSMGASLLLKRVQNIWTRGTSPRIRFLMSHSKESLKKIGKTENARNI